jgi:hypothetical protein
MAAGDVDCRVSQVKGFKGTYFDGVNGYLKNENLTGMIDITGDKDYTISANVICYKLPPPSLYYAFFAIGNGGNGKQMSIACGSAGQLTSTFYSAPIYDFAGFTFTLGQRYNFILTYNHTTHNLKAYVNGTLIDTKVATVDNMPNKVMIGTNTGLSIYSKAHISDCFVFSKVLSDEEITALSSFDYGEILNKDYCLAYWPLKEDYNDYFGRNNLTQMGGAHLAIADQALWATVLAQRALYGTTYMKPMLVKGVGGQVISTFIDA